MNLNLSLNFDGHRVRMAGTAEVPLWIAKDVCRVLGLHGASNVARDVPDNEKGVVNLTTPGGPQPYVTVTEAGLYRLISRSRKPAAARFQGWLFGEVLPSIRKHGCYPPPSSTPLPASVDLRDPLQLAAVTAQALQLVAEMTQRLAIVEPKAELADRITGSESERNLQTAAREVFRGQPNVGIGQWLKDGLLFRDSHGKLLPYESYLRAGYFRVIVTESKVDGRAYDQTVVTSKGLVWLAGRYPPTGAAPMSPFRAAAARLETGGPL